MTNDFLCSCCQKHLDNLSAKFFFVASLETRTKGPLNLPQVFFQNLPFFQIFLHSFTNIKKNIFQKIVGPQKIVGLEETFGPKIKNQNLSKILGL